MTTNRKRSSDDVVETVESPASEPLTGEALRAAREAALAEILKEREASGDVQIASDGRPRVTCRKFARAKGELGLAFLHETNVKHGGRAVMKTTDEWEAAYAAFLKAPR